MKNILGKFSLLFLLTFTLSLHATNYEWYVSSNKTQAYVNEAIYLKYTCEYKDSAELYVIEFNPSINNENYKINILREAEKIVNGKKINEYEFVLFVKNAGHFELALDTMMKKTNKDSIENSVLGRDNANYEEFSFYPMVQKSISLDIKPVESSMLGEFHLSVKKTDKAVKAFQPYHLELTIEGLGDFQVFKDFEYKLEGVKVFSEPAITKVKLTKDGYKGFWKKKFAFVSEKSFKVDGFNIEYFDLKEKKIKTLGFGAFDVEVQDAAFKREELLDEEEKPFELKKEYLYYLLTFIAGFLLAKIRFKKTTQERVQKEDFYSKVQDAKTLEKLSMLLILQNATKYKDIITQIEDKTLTSLSKVKKLIAN